MARVNVEQKALTDPRFDLLGRFLEATRHDALGRMVLVWNECQERNSYTLPERLVGAIMGDREGSTWLVEADLAEWVDDETVRIKGTEGRVEWLAAKRQTARVNGRKGGRPPIQTGTNGEPTPVSRRFPSETPPAPAPAPAPKTEDKDPPNPPSGGTVVPEAAREFLDAWNAAAAAAGWVPCRKLGGKRLRALRTRQADPDWREHWRDALAKAGPIPGLRGKNDRNWRATVDWFLRPETVTRILEGSYDGWKPAANGQAGARTEYAANTLGGIL